MMLRKLIIFVLISLVSGKSVENEYSAEDIEEYIDLVELMDSESVEEKLSEHEQDIQPVFDNGLWKCGKCDDIQQSNLIHSEAYDIDVKEERQTDLQISLSILNMQCVVISEGAEESLVKRVAGSCEGPSVTFAVDMMPHFIVNVYSK